MKPKRTADLSLYLTVTGLLLASLAFVSSAEGQNIIVTEEAHNFLPISTNPDSLLPKAIDIDDDSNGTVDYTEAALNYLSCEYDRKLDTVLNKLYQTILQNAAGNKEFVRYFKNAESAWIKYRDAELLAILGGPNGNGGSSTPMCFCEYRASLTRARISELLMWQKEQPFGDKSVCDTYDLFIKH